MPKEAYSTIFKNLLEMREFVGKEIGLSEWFLITQEKIDAFANATEDQQWIHMDTKRAAKESPYKTTIAHGFLILSLASKFSFETYQVEDVTMGINYGLDRVRFPNATPAGAKIRARVSLLSFSDIDGGAQYKLGLTYEIEGQEKPACVAEFIARAYTAAV